jgi:DNA-binding IclR family transcriptional regulator
MRSEKKSKDRRNAMPAGENKSAYIVPAVDRAVRILSLLRSERREMTIAEISDAMGYNKSSIYKLLLTLDHHGLLARDPITKRYSLGVALMEYGRAVLSGFDIQHAARPSLKALAAFSGETAVLSILRGTKLTLLEVEESTAELHVSLAIGMTYPATATSGGKAVLAYLPEKLLNEILRIEGLAKHAKRAITNPNLYRADLEATRKRGYAVDHEEFREGITGVSAPVFSSKGAIGAISIVLPAFKMTQEKIRRYGKKCAEEAARLSNLLL